ncbi:hypothetical protein HZB00_01155 [Candidatus Woesearchaeota archaeon]|nr:hypothetical protein [Candidatus Woesearchaeota archaeon]
MAKRRGKIMAMEKKAEALLHVDSLYANIAKYTHKYVFKIGIILALVIGLASTQFDATTNAWMFSILVLCGILGGFFNIAGQERKDFLMTALVVLLVLTIGGATIFSQILYVGIYLNGIITALLAFISPATVVAGLKHLFDLLAT